MNPFPMDFATCHRSIAAACADQRRNGTQSRVVRALRQGLWTAIATSLALGTAVEAASFSWDGELSQDWHASEGTKTNWDPDGFPGESDTAMIDGSHVNMNDPVKIAGLDVFSSLAIGRTLTIGTDASISNLTINGGLLAGPGAIALYAQSVLNSGGFESANQVTNHGTFTINPGFGQKGVGGSTFTNLGTINALSGLPFVNSTLVNAGNCNLINSGIINTLNSTVQNTGTITGTATANINMRLVNPGGKIAARIAGSTLSVTRGSLFTGGSIAVEDDATVQLGGTDQHVIGGTLTAAGLGNFSFNSTGIRIDGEVQAALVGSKGLWLLAGSTTGPGTIINTRRAFLEGMTIGNDGGLANSAPGGATSLFFGNQFNHAVNSRIVNTGQIVHQARQLMIGAGGQVINEASGTYEFRGIEAASVVGAGTLVNRGLMVKKGPTEAFISSVFELAGGTVEVQAGTLSLLGTGGGSGSGALQVAAGAALTVNNQYTFAGDYEFAGNGTANFASSITFSDGDSTLNMPGGGVSFNDNTGIFVIAGKLENRAKFAWTGNGVINTYTNGRFVNSPTGTLILAGQPFVAGTIENEGTVDQIGNASLRVGGGSVFENRGTYNISSGGMVMRDAGSHLFSNAAGATLSKSGPLEFSVDVPFNNQGTVALIQAAAPGGHLYLLRGGFHSLDAAFQVGTGQTLALLGSHFGSGDITFEGDGKVSLRGSYTASSGTTTLDLGFQMDNASATLATAVAGGIENQGSFTWSLGIIDGGSVGNDGEVTGGFINKDYIQVQGIATKLLRGMLRNQDHLEHKQGRIRLDTGSLLVNQRTYVFDISFFSPSVEALNAGGRFINNSRLLVRTETLNPQTATILVPFDGNSGRVEVRAGTLFLAGGGEHSGFGEFSTVVGTELRFSGGTHAFTGEHTARGTGTVRHTSGQIVGNFINAVDGDGRFVLQGGTLNGPESQPVINRSTMVFESGTIMGTGGLRNESGATATVSSGVTVAGRLTNDGTLTVLGPLNLPGTLHNLSAGRVGINGSGLFSGSGGVFDNDGELIIYRPGAFIPHRVNNKGLVDVLDSGQLTLSGAVDQFNPVAGTLTGGSWWIKGSLTLGSGQPIRTLNANVVIVPGGNFINLPTNVTGNFTNQGRLVLPGGATRTYSGVFTNTGELQVGENLNINAGTFNNSGTLEGNGTINGQFISHPGSTVAPGSSIGTLTLTGPATLIGTLRIEIDATSADRLTVAGSLDISAAALEITSIGIPGQAVYLIASYGSLTGTFASSGGIPAGYAIHYNFKGLNQIALVGASDDYLLWADGFPDFTITAPGADHDGDGLTNHEEYTFGLNPTSGTSVAPITAPLSHPGGSFKYTRRLPALTGLTYSYEFSTTLGGDSWAGFSPVVQTSDDGSPVEEISVTVPASLLTGPTGFVRVKAN